jgi:membrane-bound lytic murein transglycosylase D
MLLGAGWSTPVTAVPKVERHDLNCGDTFPCPPEIQRRVDFWIKVFRSWKTNQVIFHDSQHPERVYAVKTTKATCRRKRAAPAVERERKRIKRQLQGLAVKLERGDAKYSSAERDMLTLFPGRGSKEVRRAAGNIRCQQGNRDRFREALTRYGRYKEHILKVLRESGLSEDILYLPFVESAYNPRAYSRVGAAGLWQIMPRTARKLGLQLNATLDERFDPERATWAAARYLRRSTDTLTAVAKGRSRGVRPTDINPFVITSYNYGVAGMSRAIRKVGPDYIDVLRKYRSRSFRTAVRNFYASFLAARYVAQNADKYFGELEGSKPLRYSVVALEKPTSVARVQKVFGVSEATLRELNPAWTRYVWRGWRLIPEGYSLRLPYRKHRWRKQLARLETLPPEQPQLSGRKYIVQRGDTACGIARVFEVSCRDVIQVNDLGRRALIRVGQKLEIPARPAAKKTVVAKAASTAKPAPKSRPEPKAPPQPALRVAKVESTSATETPARKPVIVKDGETSVAGAALKPAGAPQPKEVFRKLMDGIDVAVQTRETRGRRTYSLKVEPEETLGHYADWLGIGGTAKLRRMNKIRGGTRIRVGQRIELPIKNDTQRQSFESSRLEYHQTLVDEFEQHYEVLNVERYTVKRGDNMWNIAQEHELPYWVLTRLNPGNPRPDIGDTLAVPVARARKPSKEPPISNPG